MSSYDTNANLPGHAWRRELSDDELYSRRIQDWLRHPVLWVLLAAAVGAFLGSQVGGVSQRYTKLAIGVAYLFVLLRYPTFVGAGVFLMLYAFPTVIWLGNTNFIFTALLAIIWIVRAGLGTEGRPRGTYLDWPIVLYVAVHLLSLVNVGTPDDLSRSLLALRHLFIPILFYYTLVNVGRSERKLMFLTRMLTLSTILVFATAFLERFLPGVEFIPRWYVNVLGAQDIFAAEGPRRIGGVMMHSLMGDLSAFMTILQAYLAIRAKGRPLWRALHWLTAVAAVFVLSLTLNRGALVGMVAGFAYFLWIFSREVTWKRIFVGVGAFLGLLLLGEKTIGRFEGNVTLLTRMAGTYFERGIPDTRRRTWAYAWERIMERPWLGHGPYYRLAPEAPGVRVSWPHNAFLYYLYSVGVIGLPTFVFMVARAVKRTWAGRGLSVCGASLSQGLTAVFHIGIVQFLIGQLRTDHQRGDVFVFYMWILFGMGVLAREVWGEMRRTRAAATPPAV